MVFDEDTPEKLIVRVQPTVLVKGADYTREQVVGRDIVEALGGEVILVDIVPGQSTSAMVERTARAEAALIGQIAHPDRPAPRGLALSIASGLAWTRIADLDSLAVGAELPISN